jgi:predicted nucleic acid-binding Zn ribbon protein
MMKSLGELLRKHNISSPVMKGVNAARVVEEAQKILTTEFGPEILNYAAPAYYKNKVLTIACLSSSAAQEIKLREKSLLLSLNKALGGLSVEKVHYLS